jgi:hypothetical protein
VTENTAPSPDAPEIEAVPEDVAQYAADVIRGLSEERDQLAARVTELETALRNIRRLCVPSNADHRACRIADAAMNGEKPSSRDLP